MFGLSADTSTDRQSFLSSLDGPIRAGFRGSVKRRRLSVRGPNSKSLTIVRRLISVDQLIAEQARSKR